MKRLLSAAITVALIFPDALVGQTGFTYQGRLDNGVGPVDDPAVPMTFHLYDAATGGMLLGSVVHLVDVQDGLVSVALDFGAVPNAFDGQPRWLEIEVDGNTLSPRQPVMPAPYSLLAHEAVTVPDGSIGTEKIADGSITPEKIAPGGLPCWCPPGWQLGGNFGTSPPFHFLGTTDNQPLYIKVNSRPAMVYAYAEDTVNAGSEYRSINIVGGSELNTIAAGAVGATIAGGGRDFFSLADAPNAITAAGDFGAVGGGLGNVVSNVAAVVGGGAGNSASGDSSAVLGGYANSATNIWSAVGGGVQNIAGGPAAAIAGGYANTASGDQAAIGGGYLNIASAQDTTVAGGEANHATQPYATIGGGHVNNAGSFAATIAGGYENDATHEYTTVGGGGYNNVTGLFGTISGGYLNSNTGATGSTIGGGYENNIISSHATIGGGYSNYVTGNHATIGGGIDNTAAALSATIGGGYLNTADLDYASVGGGLQNTATNYYATIGGGRYNVGIGASSAVAGGEYNAANSDKSFIGGGGDNMTNAPASGILGGVLNMAGGLAATIGCGQQNSASGDFATIPGGHSNVAAGQYTLAAGQQAQALHDGAYVWADSQNAPFASTAADQYNVRASGGVNVYTNAALTSGVFIAAGDSTWNPVSDRNAKTNFETVDVQAILERVAAMPVTTWNYKTNEEIRHMGVMAQDFYAAFRLGVDDKHISTVDADGVTIAAIQALHARVVGQESEIRALRSEVDNLRAIRAEMESLRAEIAAIGLQNASGGIGVSAASATQEASR